MPIPKPTSGETQNDYVGRCMHEIASEYDTNEQAVAICINTYEKGTMSKSNPEDRVKQRMSGINLIFEARKADEFAEEFAPAGEGKAFPWDECIAKMMDEYGDEETAKKVCGMIRSKYGS